MQLKCFIITGLLVIFNVILFTMLLYYFNRVPTDKCPVGSFLYENSSICMPTWKWCNNHIDCLNGNDENVTYCCHNHCPHDKTILNKTGLCRNGSITCEGYSYVPQDISPNVTSMTFINSSLNFISSGDFARYSEIRLLSLKFNDIEQLSPRVFIKQSQLYRLILSNNKLKIINRENLIGLLSLQVLLIDNNELIIADLSDFENSNSLEWIDLSRNSLTHDNLVLPYLPALRKLLLNHNLIDRITSNFLTNIPFINSLSLTGNNLLHIDPTAFDNAIWLDELMIGNNPLISFQITVLNPLKNLQLLGLQDINLDNIDNNSFNRFTKLSFIYFKYLYYCTIYVPNIKKCRSDSDGLSSLSYILNKPLLRVALWAMSLVTCIGNLFVLWRRFTIKDENQALTIVIKNLAVSDILMGIYLMTIGIVDIYFRGTYKEVPRSWMSSWSCTSLGMLAMIASEVSVLILSFMSIERFVLIASPFNCRHRVLTPHRAIASMTAIWIAGIIIALIPVIYWRNSTRFYGLNAMCFPLYIHDPFLIGWQYSIFVILGVNMFALIIIGYAYTAVFINILKTRNNTPLSIGNTKLALRFFLIVLTDAACWLPIIILKILALLMYPVAPNLHGWVVVGILPVNSAVNPLLYTFTTSKFREKLDSNTSSMDKRYVTVPLATITK